MTREEIEELKGLAASMGFYDDKNPCKRAVILGKAIQELEQEPRDVFDEYGNYKYPSDVELIEPNTETSMPCNDAIRRQAALDIYDDYNVAVENGELEAYRKHRKRLLKLPPVQPKPKTGHWFIDERPESDREVICSNCEEPIFSYHKLVFDYRPKFCPNCGAKMQEVEK